MAAEVTFDLGKSLEANLKENNISPAGGLRKYRKRGGEGDGPAAPSAAEEKKSTYAAVFEFLKYATAQAGKAAGYGLSAAAIVAGADQMYSSSTCDRLLVNMARATPMIPGATSYVASCDAANAAYAAAIAGAMLAAVPLAVKGATEAVKIVISEDTLKSITEAVKGIFKQSSQDAENKEEFDRRVKELALEMIEEQKANAGVAPRRRRPSIAASASSVGSVRRGGTKTKKQSKKSRQTRRRKTSKYLAAPVFAY